MFMQACTTYGDPYYCNGVSVEYIQQPVQYSPISVSTIPRPRVMPRVIRPQEPRIYEPYTYEVYDHRSNTTFNIQDRRQWVEKGNCHGGAEPTFFYNIN